jgi:3-dehydroquinate synthase
MITSNNCIEMKFSTVPERQCDILVESALLNRLGEVLNPYISKKSKLLMVTDDTIARLYLQPVLQSLKNNGYSVTSHIIPTGEESKSLLQAQDVYTAAMAAGLGRHDAMLALGGGVVGDLTGFCASTYCRGITVIQIPTTLLAQVDSAIGGKTGVNAGSIKNSVGTFHQPKAVLIDPLVLNTLSERERRAGIGEIIKYALIEKSCLENPPQESLWSLLQKEVKKNGLDAATHPEILRRCAQLKASVVTQDEFETLGLRIFLNLGHTFGHAYESLSHYGILHGEAVALGTLKAVQLAQRLGQLPPRLETELSQLLTLLGFDLIFHSMPHYNAGALLDAMRLDKKNQYGAIRLILPTSTLGVVEARMDIDDTLIIEVLQQKV